MEQSRKVAELRDNLPPICLAACKDPEKPMSSHELLEHFLQTMADSVVRASLDRDIKNDLTTRIDKLSKYQNQWIYALLDNKGYIDKPSKNLQNLAEKYSHWLRNLQVASNEHARVAFRLEEPSPKSKKKQWALQFLLQSKNDPSLFIPAKAVWKKELDTLGKLGQRFEGAHELLLTGLGYTARLFEPLKKALQNSAPEKALLNSEQAFDFLRNTAPLLEQSSFGVLVPSWWTRPSSRLGLKLHFSSSGSDSGEGVARGIVKLKNLVSYKWDIALGESTLTPEEFEVLVALKSPLVQVRGEWVRLDPELVESAVDLFEKRQQQKEIGLLEAMQLGLSTSEEIAGLPVQKVEFEGRVADWMDKLSGKEKLKLLPQPKGLKGKLRPYQRKGYSWLEFLQSLGLGACLADDMGLGKTIQTLSLLSYKKAKKQLEEPVLLIAPTSVVTNWSKEAETFTPSLRILVHQGSDRLKGKDFKSALKKTDVIISSYAVVRRDAELLKDISWQGVILDEAQNIKNPETQQSKIIYSLKASFRIALTGTPVENRLSELWSIMHFLNAGYLGSRQDFRKNIALPIERGEDEMALTSLRRLTAPFILRRLKTDESIIKDLPEKTETKVYCKLTEEQASLYEVVVQDALKEIANKEGIERSGLVLSMLMKLKQICNHPAQFLHEGTAELANRSYKLNRLKDLLEITLDVGDSSLIFTQFKEMGEMINHYLKQQFGVETLFLHGGTPAKKRAVMVERFQAEENSVPIFILSLKAGGTGLNLTKATHVFHFDRWWNPAVENQATDRAFRIGQKRNVQVHKFVCMGTLEERIDDMITKKQALADSVVSTGEKWVTELDTKTLRELVKLRKRGTWLKCLITMITLKVSLRK